MNHHARIEAAVSPVWLATRAAERAAFIRLAQTQRRISWQYRNWALEARATGKPDDYKRYAAEARRLWRDARQHLELARIRSV
jgi:hypothetical protein